MRCSTWAVRKKKLQIRQRSGGHHGSHLLPFGGSESNPNLERLKIQRSGGIFLSFRNLPNGTLPGTNLPSLKLTFSPLKMDGWNINFLWGWPIFRCHVSFRECKLLKNDGWKIPVMVCNCSGARLVLGSICALKASPCGS